MFTLLSAHEQMEVQIIYVRIHTIFNDIIRKFCSYGFFNVSNHIYKNTNAAKIHQLLNEISQRNIAFCEKKFKQCMRIGFGTYVTLKPHANV